MTFMPSTLLSMRRPSREFCNDIRLSERWPAVALLNGMLEKPVPMPPPTSVERMTLVKSTKPRGVNLATPMSKESGLALASGVCSYGFGVGAAGAVDGKLPVVLATSPPTCWYPGAAGTAAAGWAEDGAGLASKSSIFCCSSIACFSMSICFCCSANFCFNWAASSWLPPCATHGVAHSAHNTNTVRVRVVSFISRTASI